MRRAFALRPDLHHAAGFASGSENRLTFEDIHADGLLQIHIRPGLDGINCLQRVPMIGRSNEHDIHLVFLKHLSVVRISHRCLARFLPLLGNLHRTRQHVLVRIAQRHNLNGCHLRQPPEVALAIPAGANQAHAARLLIYDVRTETPQRRCRQRSSGGMQESTAVDVKQWEGGRSRLGIHGSGKVFPEYASSLQAMAMLLRGKFRAGVWPHQAHVAVQRGF